MRASYLTERQVKIQGLVRYQGDGVEVDSCPWLDWLRGDETTETPAAAAPVKSPVESMDYAVSQLCLITGDVCLLARRNFNSLRHATHRGREKFVLAFWSPIR